MEPAPSSPPPPSPACWCGHSPLEFFSPDYWRCPECETLVLRQMRGEEITQVRDDEQDFYGKAYYQRHLQESYGLPDLDQRARTDLPERCLFWLRIVLQYLPRPGARVLELGCGHGGFVALLRWAGFDATGLELSSWVVGRVRDWFAVPLLPGPLEAQDLPDASLDAIVLMDVLEHLPDPRATMRLAVRLLRPGGFLLVQTPEYPPGLRTEAEMRAAGDSFLPQLKPLEHLHLFSRSSARRLMGEVGLGAVQFVPAIFGHYDMCFVAAREALVERPESDWPALLTADATAAPAGRAVLAMLDLDTQARAAQSALGNAQTGLAAHARELDALAGWKTEAADPEPGDEPVPEADYTRDPRRGDEFAAGMDEATLDLRERLLASERERRAGRAELRRRDQELALSRRLLARRLGTDWPPPRPGEDSSLPAAPAVRVPIPEWTEGGVMFSLDRAELDGTRLVVAGWAFHPSWDCRQVETLLLIGPSLVARARRTERPDVAAHFRVSGFPGDEPPESGRHLEASGFLALVLADSLPVGVPLTLTIHLECDGVARRIATGQQIVVPPPA